MDIRHDIPTPQAVEALLAHSEQAVHGLCPQWLTILQVSMKHRPRPLSAWRDGQLVGWLPMVETRSRLFGRHLVSLPYVNAAGVVAEDDQAACALVERAMEMGKTCGADDFELRLNRPQPILPLQPTRTNKVAMTLGLESTADAQWDALASKVRSQIRKGHKLGVTTRVVGVEQLDTFYRIFARTMRDLGTPAFPKRLFAEILTRFDSEAELVQAEFEGQVVASALLIHYAGITEVPSASCLRRFNHTNANMVMYWALLERAIERSSSAFDFGRATEGDGPYRFKKQWKAQPSPMGWQRIGLKSSDTGPIVREDDKFSLAVRMWQRLPVCVTRSVGPMIARAIP
jgi:serine/alanine adding enzyme